MRWLELTVEADAEAVEAVSEIFGRVSAGTAVRPTRLLRDRNDELALRPDPAARMVVSAHVPDAGDATGSIQSTERALWHLQAFGLGHVGSLSVRKVDDADWADAWREHFVAQRIGRVVIVPSWLNEPLGRGEVGVTLDPGMAFGTGLHPTTRACLEMLQDALPMPARVLDVGSGSGILGIAALKLGAGHVTALDTDENAVAATRENASRNGVDDRILVRRASLQDPPLDTFGLVLANLVAALHVRMAWLLAAHLAAGARLIAGGIIEPREDEVVGAMARAGLGVEARRADGEWITLRLRSVGTA